MSDINIRTVVMCGLFIAAAGCHGSHAASLKADSRPAINDQPSFLDCSTLSSGLYWYGKGNRAQLATAAGSEFYDASKPTLIFFHGWEQFGVAHGKRETYVVSTTTSSPEVNVGDAWLEAGWNMAIFDWTQFSATDLLSAEKAIWSAGNSGTLAWTTCSGTSTAGVTPGKSVTDMAVDAITTAMAGYRGGNLRLVGHSLGTQLAVRVAGALQTAADGALAPKRVALLDPYWTATNQPLSADEDTNIVRSTLVNNTVWEMYKTSPLLDLWLGAQNQALTALIGELKYQPNYWSTWNPVTRLTNQHLVARNIYFSSFTLPPPKGCQVEFGDQTCLSASATDEQVADFMHLAQSFVQTKGMNTETLTDDVFSSGSIWNATLAGEIGQRQTSAPEVLSQAALINAGGKGEQPSTVPAALVKGATQSSGETATN